MLKLFCPAVNCLDLDHHWVDLLCFFFFFATNISICFGRLPQEMARDALWQRKLVESNEQKTSVTGLHFGLLQGHLLGPSDHQIKRRDCQCVCINHLRKVWSFARGSCCMGSGCALRHGYCGISICRIKGEVKLSRQKNYKEPTYIYI